MIENLTKKNIFHGVDLFKLIAACLVLLLHTIETSSFIASEIKFVFTRFAVPFFFITSGYFFYKGLNRATNKWEYFKKYEKNLIKIFIVWAIVIYLPFTISSYMNIYEGDSIIKIVLILIRRIIIIGPGPYWYLIALMLSTTFIYLIKKSSKVLAISIIIGLSMEIMYSCFSGVLLQIPILCYFPKIVYLMFSWEYNFIMFGIPFVGIGFFIAKYDLRLKLKYSVFIFILATILRIFEFNIPLIFNNQFFAENTISICFIFQAIAFFFASISLDLKIDDKKSLTIRQLSSFIYFSHAIILYNILNVLLQKFTTIPIYEPVFILPKFVVVLLICVVIFCIIKKINNKYLNILING